MHGGFSVVASTSEVSIELFKVSEDARLRVYSTRFTAAFGTTDARWNALRERLGEIELDLPDDPGVSRKLNVPFSDVDDTWGARVVSAFEWVVSNMGR